MKKALVTVVITRFAETDDIVERCLLSLSKQKGIPLEVLFLDQKPSSYIEALCTKEGSQELRMRYLQIPAKSLSFARNTGLQLASTRYVIFSDVDCTFSSNWACEIFSAFTAFQPNPVIVGTRIAPVWPEPRRWFQKSSYILEFYSMLDLGPDTHRVSKVFGASVAIDKQRAAKDAYFDEKLGRVNGILLGGEETDLCQRLGNRQLPVIYTGATTVNHWVEPERMHYSWILKRAYYGGYSRALRGGRSAPVNIRKKSLIDYLALSMLSVFYIAGMCGARINREKLS